MMALLCTPSSAPGGPSFRWKPGNCDGWLRCDLPEQCWSCHGDIWWQESFGLLGPVDQTYFVAMCRCGIIHVLLTDGGIPRVASFERTIQ